MKKPVKQSSKENIYSLVGFGKVFRFTLVQTLKNKSFVVTAILMIFMMAMMKPLMYLMSRSADSAKARVEATLDNVEADKLIIYNETAFLFDADMEAAPVATDRPANAVKKENVKFLNQDQAKEDDLITSLGAKDILVVIREESGNYKVNGIITDDSSVSVKSLDNATEYVRTKFSALRQSRMNLDESVMKSLSSGVSTGSVLSESEYMDEKEHTMSSSEFNGIVFGFAFIIMIVASLSSSYIISSVNEEKQSKLAETLLVSVRPMALLLGKVLGMLCFVAGTIVLGVIASATSNYVMEHVMHLDMSALGDAGINLAIFTGYGVKGLVVFLAEVLIGICSFGVLSGILGSACSKVEDQQNATTVVMTLSMVGYFGAFILSSKPELLTVGAMVPPLSYYIAPVSYIGGRIGIELLLVSFVIQVAVLLGLTMLAAKTYRNLLLSDSSKPKFASIFAAAKN